MFPGQTAVAELFFPEEEEASHAHPSIIMVCDYSKYFMAKFIPSANPSHCIDFLLNHWATILGYPKVILCDETTRFQGTGWQSISHNFDIQIIQAPARAAFQIGLSERHVGLIKLGYRALSKTNVGGLTRNQRLSIAPRRICHRCLDSRFRR